MTQAQIDRLCRTWQKRLRLQDWKVTVKLTPESEMPANHWARIEWDDEDMTALMLFQDDQEGAQAEENFVHELVHLRVQELTHKKDSGFIDNPAVERTVNLLTDCFLQAYPRRKRKEAKHGTQS